jgi:hypothetical protein
VILPHGFGLKSVIMLRTGLEADTRCTSALWLWQAITHREHHVAQAALIGVNCSYSPSSPLHSSTEVSEWKHYKLRDNVWQCSKKWTLLPYLKAKELTARKYALQNDSEFLYLCIHRKSYEIIHETNSAVILLWVFALLHIAWFLSFTLRLFFKVLHFVWFLRFLHFA